MRKRCWLYLKKFGFEKLDISENDLLNPDMVIQLGFPPVRIDLITSLGTANFKDMYKKEINDQNGKRKHKRYIIRTSYYFEESSRTAKRQIRSGGAQKIERNTFKSCEVG